MSKALSSQEKSKIIQVLQYFKDNSDDCSNICVEKTVSATDVSRATVYRILREMQISGTVSSPVRPKKRGPYQPVDDFDMTVIQNKVREFYTHRKQHPTLKKLHAVLKAEIDYPGSREMLRQTLRDMGFTWSKTADNRKVIMEKPEIVALRMAYFARKQELEDAGYRLVYIDETWLDSAYTMQRCWQGPGVSGVRPPCNRGQRLIVVHAGSREGFVEGAKLVYKAAASTGDYHNEMNGQLFTKWIQERLIPNLPDKCAIVMDNASYHTMQTDKCPTSSSKKDDIKVFY